MVFSAVQVANGQFTRIDSVITPPNYTYGDIPQIIGVGCSFYDFNGDGWDDLTLTSGDSPIRILVNNEGSLEEAPFTIPNNNNGYVVGVWWADYDNDGDADLFVTKDASPVELWRNDGSFNFSNVAGDAGLGIYHSRHFGASFCDYDHDGFLDLYVSVYDNPGSDEPEKVSKLYRNNGDGTFENVTDAAGVFLLSQPMMQPVFVDVNHDGWEDLFIITDKYSFTNYLFLNNGDGTFSDVTDSSGVEYYMDAMSATVGDYDHNGALDIYITNNPNPAEDNVLLKNDGEGNFTNVAEELEIDIGQLCWGALWLDYDNDSWEDLFVTVQNYQPFYGTHRFFRNEGGEAFTDVGAELGTNSSSIGIATTMGDLNNDGYYDYVINNAPPYATNIFLNEGGANHYLSVTLEGTLANRDGIGAWIHCYADTNHYVRFVMSSENLYTQNSRKKIFGLGQQSVVDSLVIEWNNGTREVYVHPQINTHHHFVEGASFTQPFEIAHSGDLLLCPGESTLLDAGEYESYLWNTGDTTQTLSISEPGIYSVETWNAFGLSANSFPVEVAVAPSAEVTFDKANVSCAGANDGFVDVTFSNGPVAEILWNTGDTVTTLEDLGPDVYSFTATDDFGCPVAGSVSISEPSPLLALGLVTDVLCFGEPTGTSYVNVIGGTPPYDFDWLGENPDALFAGSYAVSVTDINDCNIEIAYEIEQPDSLVLEVLVEHASNGAANGSAAITISGGTLPYSTTWSTGETDLLNIDNLATGNYSVVVTDGNDCVADTTFVVDTNTGMHGVKETDSPMLYPNPNTGQFRIANCPVPLVKIEVIDAVGRTIIPARTISCGSPVSLNELPPGQYSVILRHTSSRHFMRLVVVE